MKCKDKKNRIAVIGLHKCGIENSLIFKTLPEHLLLLELNKQLKHELDVIH